MNEKPIKGLSMVTRAGGSQSVYFDRGDYREVVLDTLDFKVEIAALRTERDAARAEVERLRAANTDLWAFYEMMVSFDYQNNVIEELLKESDLTEWANFSVLCDSLKEAYKAREALTEAK